MKQSIKIPLLLIVPLALGLSSCLKDLKSPSDPSGSNNVVEFQNSSVPVSYTSVYPQYANSFAVADTAGFNVNVNYTGPQFTAPQDITVTVAIDTAALDAFNTASNTSFVLPPTDVVTFPSSVTIPKGGSLGQIRVIVNDVADYDYSQNYILPLTITSSSYGIVSTNFGTAMYTFGFNNQYDGVYTVTGTMADAANPALTEYSTPFKIDLITNGATAVAMYDGINVANAYCHPILSGANGSYYGDFAPVFNIDANGNVTSVVNYYGQPAVDGRSAEIDPSGINKYDASSQTMQVSYWMDQPSVIAPHRTHFVEKFVYSSAR